MTAISTWLKSPSSVDDIREDFLPPYPLVASLDIWSPTQIGNSTFYVIADDKSPKDLIHRVVDSVKTANYGMRRQVRYKWRPVKFSLKMPHRPGYFPPEIRPFSSRPLPKSQRPSVKPVPYLGTNPERRRLAKESLDRYNASEQKRKLWLAALIARREKYYSAYVNRKTEARRLYNIKFERRMVKYRTRLAKYYQLIDLLINGKQKWKRVGVCHANNQYNPYVKQIDHNFGATGVYVETLRSIYPDRYVGDPNGLYCARRYLVKLKTSPYYDYTYDINRVWPGLEEAVHSKLISRYNEKLKNKNAHIGNIIAERAKTFQMLRALLNPKGLVASFLHSKDLSKTIGNGFLAFQFGLRPLLQDIYDTFLKLKNDSLLNAPEKLQVKVTAKSSELWTHEKATQFQASHRASATYRESYVVDFTMQNGALYDLSRFGLVNPAEIAWEVLPWSFVIDWFLPIGDYISSLTSDAGLVFDKGVYTKKWEVTMESSVNWQGEVSGNAVHSNDMKQRKYKYYKERTVLSSPPSNLFPLFKNPLSAYHIAESLALLKQRR